jgi:hypothetical protein
LKKKETHQKIFGAMVSCLKVMLIILLTIKAHLTMKVLWNFEPKLPQKTGTG